MREVSTENVSENIETVFVNSAQDLCISRVEFPLALLWWQTGLKSPYKLSHPYWMDRNWSETSPGISHIKQPESVCYFRKGSGFYFIPGLKQNCSLSAALLFKVCQCFHSEPLVPACYACEKIYVLSDSIWPKQASLLMLLFLEIKPSKSTVHLLCKPYTFPGASCQCWPFSKGIFQSLQVLLSVFGCHGR